MEIILKTERLLACRLSMDDLQDIYEMRQDPEVVRYIFGGRILSWEEEKARLEERLAYYEKRPGLGVFKVLSKESHAFLGLCNLNDLDTSGKIQIGYSFKKSAWGKGYATEISRALLRYGFDKMKLPEILGVTEFENEASMHVLRKIGLKFLGKGRYFDQEVNVFGLDKESWLETAKPEHNTQA